MAEADGPPLPDELTDALLSCLVPCRVSPEQRKPRAKKKCSKLTLKTYGPPKPTKPLIHALNEEDAIDLAEEARLLHNYDALQDSESYL